MNPHSNRSKLFDLTKGSTVWPLSHQPVLLQLPLQFSQADLYSLFLDSTWTLLIQCFSSFRLHYKNFSHFLFSSHLAYPLSLFVVQLKSYCLPCRLLKSHMTFLPCVLRTFRPCCSPKHLNVCNQMQNFQTIFLNLFYRNLDKTHKKIVNIFFSYFDILFS